MLRHIKDSRIQLASLMVAVLSFFGSSGAHAALLANISKVSAGGFHTCALTSAGGVKCWGYNYYGTLGDSSYTLRLMPVDVTGLTSGVTAIAAGHFHTCALTAAGGVKCWGDNGNGQLGNNSTTHSFAPVDVTGLTSGVTAIAAGGGSGGSHTCALTSAGGVKCWGYNYYGGLGDNSTTDRLTPVDVAGLTSGVTAIAAGYGFSCALTTAGGVKCWGNNAVGSLGDNSGTNRLTPVEVTGLASGVTALSTGHFHACALTATGGAKCWGYNYDGELGDNSTTNRWSPVNVTGLASGVTALSAGGLHTCALTAAGGVKCCGYNFEGELGDNSTTNRSTPVDVTGLTSGVAGIAAGNAHTCATTTTGGVKCWGWNDSGQIGDNSTTTRLMPVDVLTSPAIPANETLIGTTGNDPLVGGAGDDALFGLEGDDTLTPGAGNNLVYGGTGTDVLVTDSSAYGDVTTLAIAQDTLVVYDGASTRHVVRGVETLRVGGADYPMPAATDDIEQDIAQIFVAAFARAPALDGYNYWKAEKATKGIANVADTIFSLSVVKAIYPDSLPDEDFVSAIFLNVFGRAVQAGGLAYWAGELAAKSRGQLVLDMTTSALTTADGTDGKAYFNNRVDVSKYAVTRQTASAVSRSVSETTAVLSGVDGDAGGVVGAVDVVVGW